MTDFGALNVKGNATLEGEVDKISEKGTDTIVAESIGPLDTYTHTISLGDTYEDGLIFIAAALTGTMGTTWGCMVFLNTSTAFAGSQEMYSDFYSRISGWHTTLTGSNFGTSIRLTNVYLDGTDLILTFKNIHNSITYSMNASMSYAVWKAA